MGYYPDLYCPNCGGVAKCIGYNFKPGVSKEISIGLHHVYFYECKNNHRFEFDQVWDEGKFILVEEKVS